MKLSLNKIFKKSLAVTVLSLFLFISFADISIAAGDFPEDLIKLKEELKAKIPEKALVNCQESIVLVYDIEILQFINFLDGTFKNKSSTSSLTNLAIARYVEYKKTLEEIYSSLTPSYEDQGVQVYKGQFSMYALCSEITDAYLDLAKEHLKQHIRNNASQKKTSMFVEKYQAIGSKLRDLNIEVAEMYSLFAAFKNKLPFFVKKCL
jgi:hypothetical protein